MQPRFRSGGNGNSNARVLNAILRRNTVIEEVDLSYTGLDDDGIEEVRDGMKHRQEEECYAVMKYQSN